MKRGFQNGSKLYQQRAKLALPLLVARAKAHSTFTYGQLARQIGMPNPRNLNHVLGAIGHELQGLSREWKEEVPPIQCIVINKTKKTPGRGIGFYMPVAQFKQLTPLAKKQVLQMLHIRIWDYQKWDTVLKHFRLTAASPDKEIEEITQKARYGKAGGEGDDHRLLKEYIAKSPYVLGLPKASAMIEYGFPSGDEIDVMFKYQDQWTGVEVKGAASEDADILRGIFQCVKYQALIEADQKLQHLTVNSRVILVLGGTLPASLRDLVELLEIDIRDGIGIPKSFTLNQTAKAASAR